MQPSSYPAACSHWQPSSCGTTRASWSTPGSVNRLGKHETEHQFKWGKQEAHCLAICFTFSSSTSGGMSDSAARSRQPCIFSRASLRLSLPQHTGGLSAFLHNQRDSAAHAKRAHCCERVKVDVTTSSPSLLIRFFSCNVRPLRSGYWPELEVVNTSRAGARSQRARPH
jgi:hypothetical protein